MGGEAFAHRDTCSTTGNELLEVWYYGDLLTVKGEPQSYIVDGDELPGLVAARDPESGEEFVIFDGGRHGYDNLFCDEHDPAQLAHRPLTRYEIPASKLVLELGDADRGSWSQQGDASLASTANGAVTLYPVSTFDLNGFAACAQNNSAGDATVFEQAKDNGSAFYHAGSTCAPPLPERAPAK